MTTSSLSWTRAAVQSYPCTSRGFGSWEMIEETLGGRNPEGTLGSAALMSSPESVLLIICSLNALGHLGAGQSQFFPLTSLQRQSRAAAFPPGFLLSSFCLGSSTSLCCWRHLSCPEGGEPIPHLLPPRILAFLAVARACAAFHPPVPLVRAALNPFFREILTHFSTLHLLFLNFIRFPTP